jgi:hypothetical protein
MADDDDKREHLTEQEIAFMEAGGGARMTRSRFSAPQAKPRPKTYKPRKRTGGALPKYATSASIYVAMDRAGRVKIGMTSDGAKRAVSLHATIHLEVPVAPAAALHVETEAFNILGHSLEAGEWVNATLGKAMAAVWLAKARAARVMAVEPGLSSENARLMRLGLAELNLRE